jgi:hypothetical protein
MPILRMVGVYLDPIRGITRVERFFGDEQLAVR